MTDIYLETVPQRSFACAYDWPGWVRSGKTEEAAIKALAASAVRSAEVARQAGVAWPASAANFKVLERIPGTGTTSFGAPGEISEKDRTPLTAKQADRLVALVRAAWTILDRVIARAPEELPKGPRGGGRDRDQIMDHVLGAEHAYARKIGVRHPQPKVTDTEQIESLRSSILEGLRNPPDPIPEKGWPPRYAARRIAWHALDHAWEIEDKTAK
jgi:hypothetical protein